MNKEQELQYHKEWTRQLIEVMQAYLDGKEIECQEESDDRYCPNPWKQDILPLWDWAHADYQVKGNE